MSIDSGPTITEEPVAQPIAGGALLRCPLSVAAMISRRQPPPAGLSNNTQRNITNQCYITHACGSDIPMP